MSMNMEQLRQKGFQIKEGIPGKKRKYNIRKTLNSEYCMISGEEFGENYTTIKNTDELLFWSARQTKGTGEVERIRLQIQTHQETFEIWLVNPEIVVED